MTVVALLLINIQVGSFQCSMINQNGHLEPHTTDVRFAIKVLLL